MIGIPRMDPDESDSEYIMKRMWNATRLEIEKSRPTRTHDLCIEFCALDRTMMHIHDQNPELSINLLYIFFCRCLCPDRNGKKMRKISCSSYSATELFTLRVITSR